MHPKVTVSHFTVYNFMFYVLLKINLKIKDTLILPKPLKPIKKVIEKPGIMAHTYNSSIQETEARGCRDG